MKLRFYIVNQLYFKKICWKNKGIIPSNNYCKNLIPYNLGQDFEYFTLIAIYILLKNGKSNTILVLSYI